MQLDAMYRDMGPGAAMPSITKVVLEPMWIRGVPLALVGGLVAFHVLRPRFALVAFGLMAVAVCVFWYVAMWAPIHALTNNIR
jgi:hypothetical protein